MIKKGFNVKYTSSTLLKWLSFSNVMEILNITFYQSTIKGWCGVGE